MTDWEWRYHNPHTSQEARRIRQPLYIRMRGKWLMFGYRVLLLMLAVGVAMQAQVARAQTKVIATTVCAVANDPAGFNNKFVRFRASLTGNFEISAIRDPDRADCHGLWFTYPGSGPVAYTSLNALLPNQPRPPVHLEKDSHFTEFQKLVDARMYPRRRDMGCRDCKRYKVTALMTGLVEYAGRGKGFGHLNLFPVQFVLQSILQTSVKDLASKYNDKDFSTTPVRFPTGYIEGRLLGPDGQAIADGDLEVYSAAHPPAHIEDDSATTDEKGNFKFALPPGKYIIGFNTFWAPAPNFPYPPTYYPSAKRRSAAKVIAVADREHVSDLLFRLGQQLVPRKIPIKVVWPDGKPVDDANVWLSPRNDPRAVVGISVSHTASDGTFTLIGFKGLDYALRADKYAGLGQVSCAKTILVRTNQRIVPPIRLPLAIHNYKTCIDSEDEVPPE
jgi:hypothetical protein